MIMTTMNIISLFTIAFTATNSFTHALITPHPLQNALRQPISMFSLHQRQERRNRFSYIPPKLPAGKCIRSSVSTASSTLLKERPDLEDAGTTTSFMKTNNILADNEQNAGIYKQAIRRTLYWVAAAIGYGFLLIFAAGPEVSGEFYAGYLLEQSLSIDNLLVFLLLFEYFKVPMEYQNRILNWGILGSIVMRATMIGAGAVALRQFREVLLVFASILLFSSYKVIVEEEDEEDEDLSENAIVKFANNLFSSTDQFDGDNFFTEIDGIRKATPMLLCMIAVEISDVVFAVDSIPAIFGVTEDPLVVFSSNMFAIMGLRSLYIILSKAASELKYLEKAVAVVLGFIGGKLIAEYFGVCISTEVSLGVVVTMLGGGVAASILDQDEEDAIDITTTVEK
mmetsp:Transcript_24835/g.58271  ORF Transcript_24835/g.58271 Transcript_24835/m.58271 type:complete len:396 (-) Transcript_24835:44-1231(-)|eukprot:CAMPEP_0197173462 /NCGR_PEP_ID=MMETSP1423-20130617/386_1 /TAXON_ID=476441 /ORGANISM="Pseudo-nitzschia heimii, Strain UNC1101" /LENGTH=395 /DNA_ID=CAMNT_0042622283 /DNA_START=302 /DNA_END=1489 /DNA_ORIENTATION=+